RDHDRVAGALLSERSERLADGVNDRGGERPADNPADVVGFEDVRRQEHATQREKNAVSRRGSQPSPPPPGNPPWPPASGCSSITVTLVSGRVGKDEAGMNGSLRALSTSVGTLIARSQGLLLARRQ